MPPINPDSMPSADPPPLEHELPGNFVKTVDVSGHEIDEYTNCWIVKRLQANGAVFRQQVFHKRRGFTYADAVAYAANEHAKHNGGS